MRHYPLREENTRRFFVKDSGKAPNSKQRETSRLQKDPDSVIHGRRTSPNSGKQNSLHGVSDGLYRVLVEAAGQAGHGIVILQDTDDKIGEIVFVNAGLAGALGYGHSELLGRTMSDLICPEDLPIVAERYAQRQKGENVPSCYELRGLRRDGTRVPLEISAVTAVIDGKVSTMAFVRDVSQNVSLIEDLERSERRYRLLAENLSDVLFTSDMQLRPTYFSPSITRLLGFSVEEAESRRIHEALTPESLPVAMKATEELLEGNRTETSRSVSNVVQLETIRKDGSTVWIEAEVSVLRSPDGHPQGFLGVIRDVSNRKLAEDRLRESEEKYRQLVENINAAIYSVDENAITTYISPTFETLFGTDPAELIGKRFADFIHPEDLPASMESLRKVMSASLMEPWECRMVLPGSSQVYWVQGHNRPVYKDGCVVGFQGVLVDITRQKQAEQALELSEKKYRTLVESSPDGILSVDAHKRIVECNEGICRLLGYAKEEIKGADVGKVATSSALEKGDAFTQQIDANGCVEAELEMLHRDGHSVPVWVKMVGIHRAEQGEYEIMAYLRNMEERKRVDEMKDQFINMVSHEIRTPLTVIMGAVNTVLSEGGHLPRPESRRLLEDASSEADQLSHILDNLLELSRSQAKRLTLQLEPLVLEGVVHKIIEQARRHSPMHTFVVDLPNLLPALRADRTRLERILHNLVENAVKYSPGGEIRVSARRDGRNLVIGVHDQGPGIPTDDRAKLFEPFHRARQAETGGVSGIGLGLLVCRSLVEAHGGQIWLESEPGQGTTFNFTIPIYAKS